MVAAGEWPEPALMEQIVAAGDEAVEPLLEVLRTEPEGWPEEAPLYNAVGLLSEIRPPRAIPALVGRHPADQGRDRDRRPAMRSRDSAPTASRLSWN